MLPTWIILENFFEKLLNSLFSQKISNAKISQYMVVIIFLGGYKNTISKSVFIINYKRDKSSSGTGPRIEALRPL